MKERPILFSAPMVRAILEGRKTQTRRVVKPQPEHGVESCHYSPTGWAKAHEKGGGACTCVPVRAPYGVPGDQLWVKETWRTEARYDALKPTQLPDGVLVSFDADYTGEPNDGCRGKTRVSLHMQRRHSRISLRITDVRVERLNDCSEADALAEGVVPCWPDGVPIQHDGSGGICREAYAELWEHINGPGSWAANPWVWVVEFERVTP